MVILMSETEGIEGNIFVVTGGRTPVGAALCLELMRREARQVRCFDSRKDSPWLPTLTSNGVTCITGDLKKKEQVLEAFKGADCVFHLASHGISGKEMLQARRIDEVNLDGTLSVLDCCIKCGIKRLIFTSSYNVIFGGKEISNGTELMNYYPLEDHIDPFGRSISLVEQLVLKNNDRSLKDKTGHKLRTCVIRPAMLYGPGVEHYIPRFLDLAQKGLFWFCVGDANVQTDWVYIDNLVNAELLASMALLDNIPGRPKAPAAGQTYFISDGSPVNSFVFVRPLLESLGYKVPQHWLSVKYTLVIAWMCWVFYSLLYPWLDKWWLPQPPIFPAEVYKVGITHHFSIMKARQQLGYVPFVSGDEGMKRTIEYWREDRRKGLESPTVWCWLLVCTGMVGFFVSAFVPPPLLGPLEWIRLVHLFVFRSRIALQIGFLVAFSLHLGEALFALFLAKKIGNHNAKGWFWQTFALGFFSLRYLLRKKREMEKNDVKRTD